MFVSLFFNYSAIASNEIAYECKKQKGDGAILVRGERNWSVIVDGNFGYDTEISIKFGSSKLYEKKTPLFTATCPYEDEKSKQKYNVDCSATLDSEIVLLRFSSDEEGNFRGLLQIKLEDGSNSSVITEDNLVCKWKKNF